MPFSLASGAGVDWIVAMITVAVDKSEETQATGGSNGTLYVHVASQPCTSPALPWTFVRSKRRAARTISTRLAGMVPDPHGVVGWDSREDHALRLSSATPEGGVVSERIPKRTRRHRLPTPSLGSDGLYDTSTIPSYRHKSRGRHRGCPLCWLCWVCWLCWLWFYVARCHE